MAAWLLPGIILIQVNFNHAGTSSQPSLFLQSPEVLFHDGAGPLKTSPTRDSSISKIVFQKKLKIQLFWGAFKV